MVRARIVANQVVAPGHYKMVLESEEIVGRARPGQFIHVRCSDDSEPLLRRPLGVHALVDRGTFAVLYRVKGRGTAFLSRRKARDELDMIGPLGRGFEVFPNDERALLVAGGMGVAPLLFLAQELIKAKRPVVVVLGADTKERLLALSDFKSLGVAIETATEDGSAGAKGLVSDIFENILVATEKPLKTTVYACGPPAMLARVSTISAIYDVACQVCLEERMACGVGACLSCVVKTKQGYQRVCAEGPVFDGEDIEWTELGD